MPERRFPETHSRAWAIRLHPQPKVTPREVRMQDDDTRQEVVKHSG